MNSKSYNVVVPTSQKSVQITSSQLSAGASYFISVYGVNSMPLSGGKSGSVVYVGGGNMPYTSGITVEAP